MAEKAITPRYIAIVKETTERGELVNPSGFIMELMMVKGATKGMMLETLLDQANLARQRNKQKWLQTVARDAESYQFAGHDWIDRNLLPLKRASRPPSSMPSGPTRDRRLDIDPLLERRRENAATCQPMDVDVSVSTEEEERLLAETTPSPEVSSLVQAAQGSLSPEKTTPRTEPAEASSSSIVASSHTSAVKTRSPVRFPSPGPRRRSPRKKAQVEERTKEPSRPCRRTSPQRHPRSSRRSSPRKRPSSTSGHRGSPMPPPKRDAPHRSYARDQPRSHSRSPQRKRHQERRRGDAYKGTARDQSRKTQGTAEPKKMVAETSTADDRELPVARTPTSGACPISQCDGAITRSHASTHLPAIFNDQLEPTEDLTRGRVSALRICESLLLGTVTNLDGLVNFVNDLRQIRRGHYHVSIRQSRAMAAMCQLQDYEIPEEFSTAPVNSPAALLHWRVLLVIFACLNERDRLSLVERYPVTGTWSEEETRPEAFDSHFHLDRSRNVLRRRNASVEELCEMVLPDREYAVRLTGGVVVFCDPSTYPTQAEVLTLQQAGFHIAIGMHPKQASLYTEADHIAMQNCLSFPGVKILGEIGVDYSVEPSRWANQHVLLDKVLKHLQSSHVLVLHARAIQGDQTGVGYIQLLFQLKGVVPSNQKIHLHCFEGTTDIINRWIEEFPNTYFGFTGLVGSFNTTSKDALRSLSPDKLLLETDSPYFHIGGRRHSSPGLIGMVAKMVADIRKENWIHVLEFASRNARQLYGDGS